MSGRAVAMVLAIAGLVLVASVARPVQAGKKAKAAALTVTGRTLAGPARISLEPGTSEVVWLGATKRDVCVTATKLRGLAYADFLALGAVVNPPIGVTGFACYEDAFGVSVQCPNASPDICEMEWRVDLLDAFHTLIINTNLPEGSRTAVVNQALGISCQGGQPCWAGVLFEDVEVELEAQTSFCAVPSCALRAQFHSWTGCDATGPGPGGADSVCRVRMNRVRQVLAAFTY